MEPLLLGQTQIETLLSYHVVNTMPSYLDMSIAAIKALKDRSGSSGQAIKKVLVLFVANS